MLILVQAAEPERAKLRKPTNALRKMATNNTRNNKAAEAAEVEAAPMAAFDLAAFMAAASQTVENVKAAKVSKTAKATSAERQRCSWPDVTEAAASAAGIRLPGLFPKPGSKSAKNGLGWYREPAGAGSKGEPGRNDLARQILWRMIGQPLSAGQMLPSAAVLATAAAIRQEYQQSSATPPEWSLYLIQPTEARADGTKVGQQTCLLQQLANMVNGPVMLTPDAIRKV